MKSIGLNDSVENKSSIGECLKLPYYSGVVEYWMVAINFVLITTNVISMVITLLANTVFLLAYFKTRLLRTSHYFFLVLLAITDISVGLISQPLFIGRKIMEIHSSHDCVVWVTMRATIYYLSGISFLTLTLVSIERFYAVCRPMKHRHQVTKSRMVITASIVWSAWLLFPIIRFSFPKFYRVFGMFVGGVILILFAVNGFIYFKIRRYAFGKTSIQDPEVRKNCKIKDIKKEANLAKTVACLMLVMILAYLPAAIGLAYKAIAGVNTTYMFVFLPIADTLVLLNSSFNPLFYCYKNKNIRIAIVRCYKETSGMSGASSTSNGE